MLAAVVEDLMLRSRVASAAKAVSVEVRFVSSESQIAALDPAPRLVIVDLNGRRIDGVALVGRLKADPRLAGIRILGFVAHVDGDTVSAARAAGIDEVMARGAFVDRLPELLRGATA
jgi:CheY-like chemotaxis protein